MTQRVHVVAAVIENKAQQIFIAKRPLDKHQGGLWEFPGGKVEPGETAQQALSRELHEEIGIEVIRARPLIQINHDYPDKSVCLDVWKVSEFSGEAHGKENQDTCWVYQNELRNYSFPAANQSIITAALLPEHYMITPEPGKDEQAFLSALEDSINKHQIKLLQFRAKTLSQHEYVSLAIKVQKLCKQYHVTCICNTDSDTALQLNADGIHLSSQRLMQTPSRPLPKNKWVAASCHNLVELKQAMAINADFVVIAPVLPTQSHPGCNTLGWDQFKSLTVQTDIPVYALGGMSKSDLEISFLNGAQGIAGISVYK